MGKHLIFWLTKGDCNRERFGEHIIARAAQEDVVKKDEVISAADYLKFGQLGSFSRVCMPLELSRPYVERLWVFGRPLEVTVSAQNVHVNIG